MLKFIAMHQGSQQPNSILQGTEQSKQANKQIRAEIKQSRIGLSNFKTDTLLTRLARKGGKKLN